MRVAAVQSWPQLAKAPTIAPSAAASRFGVLEHHERRLAAELHVHALDRAGRLAHDARAGARGAGDRDQRDVLVAGERAADLRAGPGHDVEHARRQAGVERQAAEHQRGQRRQLGRLEHDRVAGRERRPDLPGRHVERVVPGRDRGADADRLAPDRARQAFEVLARRLALEVAGGGGEEAQVVDRQRDVEGARELQRLAGVARLGARELVRALLEQVGHAVEHRGALAGGDAAPVAAAEGGARGRDGALGVGRRWRRRPRRSARRSPGRRPSASLAVGTSCPSISSAWACALSAMDILDPPTRRHLSALRRSRAMDTAACLVPE